MDPDLEGIFVFVTVMTLICFAMAHIFHRRNIKHAERKLELKVELERAKATKSATTADDNSLIEDRLRVLERIVTDQPDSLSREIEDLRRSKVEAE
ncbi:hypothetical protein [Aurantiacibacter sp. D1-12]|uniref:hypothetical protein n=1 Tax=Aurantiacibacter sp. D1-12 TaxID=2993658 RepID=UPI00237C90B6|nr:hypothetical protein [Aurantiacibacter sp. D1-12]MDE1466155.1 hypothetical protein [Aurantiacibacter sp. D1-12]